jgi:hypothetical protein
VDGQRFEQNQVPIEQAGYQHVSRHRKCEVRIVEGEIRPSSFSLPRWVRTLPCLAALAYSTRAAFRFFCSIILGFV